MIVKLDTGSIKRATPADYFIRFVFGGAITAIAGLVGDHWGPMIGGLLLAFPAIFPASITLLAREERERKTDRGLTGTRRGLTTAADYAAGTALGSAGLASFAAVCWWSLERLGLPLTLTIGLVAWSVMAGASWTAFKRRPRRRRSATSPDQQRGGA